MLQCLIYKVNLIASMDVQEKTVYVGFGTICGSRHPLGVLELTPVDGGGLLYYFPSYSMRLESNMI